MSKAITYIITFLIIFVAIPYGVYTIYYNHQDGIYKTLKEFDSYTTVDKDYRVDVMKYKSVADGEEQYTFKIYLVDNKTNEATFIKNIRISAYGTECEFTEDTDVGKYNIYLTVSSSEGSESLIIDVNEKKEYGKKLRGII